MVGLRSESIPEKGEAEPKNGRRVGIVAAIAALGAAACSTVHVDKDVPLPIPSQGDSGTEEVNDGGTQESAPLPDGGVEDSEVLQDAEADGGEDAGVEDAGVEDAPVQSDAAQPDSSIVPDSGPQQDAASQTDSATQTDAPPVQEDASPQSDAAQSDSSVQEDAGQSDSSLADSGPDAVSPVCAEATTGTFSGMIMAGTPQTVGGYVFEYLGVVTPDGGVRSAPFKISCGGSVVTPDLVCPLGVTTEYDVVADGKKITVKPTYASQMASYVDIDVSDL